MHKMLLAALAVGSLLLVNATRTFAEDKTVTVTGEGKCAKCALKESDKCQNVIQAKEGDKTVTYYIAKNDVSDKFHKNVCSSTKKVTAKGTCKLVNGKMELTATELKVAEEGAK